MSVNRTLVCLLWLCLSTFLAAQVPQEDSWFQECKASALDMDKRVDPIPCTFKTITVDPLILCSNLENAPLENLGQKTAGMIVHLPMPDGSVEAFEVWNSCIMEAPLALKFPEIQTYKGRSRKNSFLTTRFTVSPLGLDATIKQGHEIFFIKPFAIGENEQHIVYKRTDLGQDHLNFECLTDELLHTDSNAWHPKKGVSPQKNPEGMRQLRFAVAAAGEYTDYMGGTVSNALSGITAGVNSCNLILEQEVNTRLLLIADNDQVIYTNPNSDPYVDDSHSDNIDLNETNLSNVIGKQNYDLGHVVNRIIGGLSWVGTICSADNRARSSSYLSNTDYETLIHEVGHQLNASHSFNSNYNTCYNARFSWSAFEPGSGSTMMSYAQRCGSDDIQEFRHYYFNNGSLYFMLGHMDWVDCLPTVPNGNNAPTIDVGGDYVIPKETPFMLSATGGDPDGDPISYSWEQNDLGPPCPHYEPFDNAPLFRSWPPRPESYRVFPRFVDLLQNTTSLGEYLPDYERTMVFNSYIRDNNIAGGCVSSDEMTVTVTDDGPFEVTSHNNGGNWEVGDSETIEWNVAGTTSNPIDCDYVDVILLIESNYPGAQIMLAEGTTNDGSKTITVPNVTTDEGRILVRCSDNIFFDINNSSISITPAPVPAFQLTASAIDNEVCTSENASYNLEIGSILAYSGDVDVSVSGLPTGASYSLSDNSPSAPSSLTLFVEIGTNTPSGNYDFNVLVTDGNQSESYNLELNAYVIPNAPSLEYPTQNMNNFPSNGLIEWADSPDASSYQIQIAEDGSFNNIILDVTVNNSQLDVSGLNTGTVYFWRVRSISVCGMGSFSGTRAFETSAAICSNFSATNTPFTIPHAGTHNLTSEIIWPTGGSITDVNIVNMAGTHSNVGDLTFILQSPSGTEVLLVQNQCGNMNNFSVSWDDESSNSPACPYNDGGTYQPVGDLSDFDGEDAQGIWRLRIIDSSSPFGGQMESWELDICTQSVQAPIYVDLRVFLEGPYKNNNSMQANLASIIPLEQTYNQAPYNYMGNEEMNTVPLDVVDWVLVEARSGVPSLTGSRSTLTAERRAGVLLSSGEIVDPNGGAPLQFSNITAGQEYYFVVRHRNHLDVMTADPIVVGSAVTYDFTSAQNKALGNQQMKLASDGKAVMYSGDFNGDATIQTTDFDEWNFDPALLNVYYKTDGNLDGTIQNTDFDLWKLNKATLGIAELQF